MICSMIAIKNFSVFETICDYEMHAIMKDLLRWINARYEPIIITCAFEKRSYNSVHSTKPYRGVDIRSRVFVDPQKIVDEINEAWIYDPERLDMDCAIYHNSGRGPHIHLQVHDNTILKGD